MSLFNYIKRKLKKKSIKKTFKEYGYEIKDFLVSPLDHIQYAQWLHPLEKPKKISIENINFYKSITTKNSFIIDIGAHTGDTTIPMSLAVGKQGKVLAIEPNPYVFKILKKNTELNPQLTTIVPECFAVTEKEGTFVFNYSDASFCNGGFLSQIQKKEHKHNYTLEVEGKNLYNYLTQKYTTELQQLSLIKIDAEGYDKEILKTIPDILNTYKPALMVECYRYLDREERDDLFNTLSNHGYLIFSIENFESLDTLKEIKREDMMYKKHFEILALHQTKKDHYKFLN